MSQLHTQLLTDDTSGLLVERTFRLRVVSGPDQGKEHVLDEGTTMVGTHADNDLVLTDATVSRYHLEIRVRRDSVTSTFCAPASTPDTLPGTYPSRRMTSTCGPGRSPPTA